MSKFDFPTSKQNKKKAGEVHRCRADGKQPSSQWFMHCGNGAGKTGRAISLEAWK